MEFGYALSSEEHEPNQLVAQARRAEEDGLTFALISDHFHPWPDRQGQSPFEPYLKRIRDYEAAGYNHLYIHQVGPDQEGFLRFYRRDIRPALHPVPA